MPSYLRKLSFPILTTLLLGMVSTTFTQPVNAWQDDDPFGTPANQGTDDPFGGTKTQDSNPFGGTGTTTPTTPTNQSGNSGASATPKKTPAVVLAIRETNPTTPAGWMKALRIMVDTENYGEAKVYLDKLRNAGLDDPANFDLVEQIGSDFLMRLIRTKQLSPDGGSFAREMMESSYRHLTSAGQLQTYFNELVSESPTARSNAIRGMKRAGLPALVYLVNNGPSANANDLVTYQSMAASISDRMILPLEAVIASGNEKQQAFAISAVGIAQSKSSVPILMGPYFNKSSSDLVRNAASIAFLKTLGGVPSQQAAKQFLQKRVLSLIKGYLPYSVNPDGKVRTWQWTADGKMVSQLIDPELARIVRMERLSNSLFDIDRTDSRNETIYLASQLTALKTFDKGPIADSVSARKLSEVPSAKWVGVLDFCVENKLFSGAVAAAEIIGQSGNDAILRTSDFSPLIKAMESGDRKLRFACTEAIMKLSPKRAFAGANKFLESVAYFAGSQGGRRVIIAHPKYAEGQNLIGALAQYGISGSVATTGRDLFQKANNDSDLEFMLISDAIDQPRLGELLTQLRSQSALARIPIGILSQKHFASRNNRLAANDPMTITMRQPFHIVVNLDSLLSESNDEINNHILTWVVLSDLLKQSLASNNRTVSIQVLDTMRAAYNDDFSNLEADNTALVKAMRHSDSVIRSRATKLFNRISRGKPLYEKPIEQPTVSGRALVIYPRARDIQGFTDQLTNVGFTVNIFSNADRAVAVIPKVSQIKFVVMSSELGELETTKVKRALAKRFRLNPVPIAFVDQAESYRDVPNSKPVFESQVERVIALNETRVTPELIRQAQAKTALTFLKSVTKDRETFGYLNPLPFERQMLDALKNPALVAHALPVLGELATPKAQLAIVNYASDFGRPIAMRQAAKDAFRTAVLKRGILLTKVSILEQYGRYNQSASADKETQAVLGELLDIIESKGK